MVMSIYLKLYPGMENTQMCSEILEHCFSGVVLLVVLIPVVSIGKQPTRPQILQNYLDICNF